MPIYQLDQLVPQISSRAWVAPSADIIGDVRLDADAGVWFHAVLRGDIEYIHIGKGANIQDGSVLHSDYGIPLVVEPFVTVGHQAMLHSCHVGEGSLIGMKATLLNHSRIGKNSIVAAGALVTEGKTFPDGVLIMGSPAKIVRELSDEDIAKIHQNTQNYIERIRRYVDGFCEIK